MQVVKTGGFRALCASALFGVLSASGANALLIDDFGAGSLNFVGPSSSFELFTASTMVGGERDETITNLSPSGGILSGATGNTYSYGALNSNGSAVLVWDGVDGVAGIDPTGLGGVDFTDAGTTTGFSLQFDSNDFAAPITLIVFSSGANFSSVTVNSPGGIPTGPATTLFVPFASFVPTGLGADFASVGAFSMQIDGSSEPQLDMTLSFVETTAVPEPGTVGLFGLGLAVLAAGGRARRLV